MQATTFTFKTPDGPEIFVYKWAPDAGIKPKAVVQKQLARNDHDRLIWFTHSTQIFFVLFFPIRRNPNGAPRGFHQKPSAILASTLGDLFFE